MNLHNRIRALEHCRPAREMTDAELKEIIARGLGLTLERVEALTDDELLAVAGGARTLPRGDGPCP